MATESVESTSIFKTSSDWKKLRKECVPALTNRSKWNSESRHLKLLIETDMPDISDIIRRSRRSVLKTVIAAAGTPAEFRRSTNKMAKCFAGVGIGDVDFVTMIDTPKQS